MCWDNSVRASAFTVVQQPAEVVYRPEASDFSAPSHAPVQAFPSFVSTWPSAAQFLVPGIPVNYHEGFAHLHTIKQPLCSAPFLRVPLSLGPFAPAPQRQSCSQDEPAQKRLALSVPFWEQESGAEASCVEALDASLDLPDECLANIFSLLTEVADRMACSSVCRRWLHVLSLSKKRAQGPPAATGGQSLAKHLPQKELAKKNQGNAPTEVSSCEEVSGLSRTLEGLSACDARLMAAAVALADKGGLEKLVVRASGRHKELDEGRPSRNLVLTASGVQAIAQCSPNLRSVALWDCDWLDDESIVVLARHCHKLQKLDIMNCPRISDKSLMALARFCPRLSVLSLTRCRLVSDSGLAFLAKGCGMLSSISLDSCPHIVGRGLAVLGSACKKLSGLRLAGSLGLTDEGFRAIGAGATGLQRLRLHQLGTLTEEGFKALASAPGFRNITGLTVSSCSHFTSSCLSAIASGCGQLKSLTLANCPMVTDQGILALLENGQKLESVMLQKLPGITHASARHALEQGCRLQSLTISACPGVRDPSVTEEPLNTWNVNCSVLSNFRVSDCVEVGDVCLRSMSGVGSSLVTLDLCGLPEAGDDGVMSFLEKSSTKLSSVDLSGCRQITDKAVVSIAERCGDHVRSLNLDGCSKVTDRSLKALAKTCIALEDLDLSCCDVTDRGLSVLLDAVGHSLVNLSLSGCVRISDKSVEKIIFSCHSLSGLNLKNCSRLTPASVERLRMQTMSLSGPSCLFIDP